MTTQNIPSSQQKKEITFKYKNWRGDTAVRTVIPQNIWYGESQWHSGFQWFMRAHDIEKGEIRDFALADMSFLPAKEGK